MSCCKWCSESWFHFLTRLFFVSVIGISNLTTTHLVPPQIFFHGRILAPQHDGHFLPLVGVQIVASIMLLPIFGFLQQVFLYSMLNMLITSLWSSLATSKYSFCDQWRPWFLKRTCNYQKPNDFDESLGFTWPHGKKLEIVRQRLSEKPKRS